MGQTFQTNLWLHAVTLAVVPASMKNFSTFDSLQEESTTTCQCQTENAVSLWFQPHESFVPVFHFWPTKMFMWFQSLAIFFVLFIVLFYVFGLEHTGYIKIQYATLIRSISTFFFEY